MDSLERYIAGQELNRQAALEAEKKRKQEEARELRRQRAIGRIKRDERLALLGCECGSCSTISGLEYGLSEKALRVGRADNPVHEYLTMRAYAADRMGGGGMGWYMFEFYCTCIALVMRLDNFNTSWGLDDEYVVDMRREAFQLAVDHGFLPYLGYEFKLEAVREYLAADAARREGRL